VTVCTQGRACLFGDVVDSAMNLNHVGRSVATLWNDIPARFPGMELDAFVVMPNHIHGIILLPDNDAVAEGAARASTIRRSESTGGRATTRVAPTVGHVVGAFKSLPTVAYIRNAKANRLPAFHSRLWQRNYYEHVIRDEADLDRIRRYIDENPARWEFDDENPQRVNRTATPTS
jgi:putative transposase